MARRGRCGGLTRPTPALFVSERRRRDKPSRGIHAAARSGEIGQDLADSFDDEASLRVANGTFSGAILFLNITRERRMSDLFLRRFRCRPDQASSGGIVLA